MHALSVRGSPFLALAPPDAPRSATLSPINRRRLRNFRANRRAVWSLWLFAVLFVITLVSELIANDRPIAVMYNGQLLLPVVVNYPESTFGGFMAETSFRDPFIADEINANGWMLWPPIRFDYRSVDDAL